MIVVGVVVESACNGTVIRFAAARRRCRGGSCSNLAYANIKSSYNLRGVIPF